MIATPSTPGLEVPEGPSMRLRICAVAVILALAALAAYTVFSGPTKVPVRGPSSAPTRGVKPAGEPDSGSEGESRGD